MRRWRCTVSLPIACHTFEFRWNSAPTPYKKCGVAESPCMRPLAATISGQSDISPSEARPRAYPRVVDDIKQNGTTWKSVSHYLRFIENSISEELPKVYPRVFNYIRRKKHGGTTYIHAFSAIPAEIEDGYISPQVIPCSRCIIAIKAPL